MQSCASTTQPSAVPMSASYIERLAHSCRLSTLASTVARLVEAIIKASEQQTAESASLLQQILAAAADERGEWHWPLPDAQAAAFEQVSHVYAELHGVVMIRSGCCCTEGTLSWASNTTQLRASCRPSGTTLHHWMRPCCQTFWRGCGDAKMTDSLVGILLLPWKELCTWTVFGLIWGVTLCGAICAEVYLVLQRVLQRYAALSLVKDSDDPAEACLNTVIAEEPSSWPELFR